MAATWGEIRADVLRVHGAYCETFGLPGHKLRNAADSNACILADAIDAHGEAACMLVLRHAKADGMVSGKQDEKGVRHESIRYLFDNADTFARIHRAGELSEGKSAKQRPALDVVREAMAR